MMRLLVLCSPDCCVCSLCGQLCTCLLCAHANWKLELLLWLDMAAWNCSTLTPLWLLDMA